MEFRNDLNILEGVGRQYRAALEMLGNAVRQCPESAWLDASFPNKYWHLAYHALFYTHLYMQESEADFTPWRKHRPDYQFLGTTPWPPYDRPKIETPYNKEDILEFHQFCSEEIEVRLRSMDFSAPSGFHWLPVNKLELQLYNLRHLQHHTGQLVERLRSANNIGIAWVRGV